MRFSYPLLVAASLSLLAGCSSLNPFSSKGPQPAELVEFEATADLRQVWEARVGGAGDYRFQPAVVEDAVYAAAHNGTVMRIEDGRTVWRTELGGRLSAGVGSNGRLVVVVTTVGDVVGLDADTGSERWRTPVGIEVLAPPAVAERNVAVRASDNRIIGFDIEDGERQWVYQRAMPPLSLRNVAGMTVEGNDAMIGYPGGKVVGLSLDKGVPLWELTVATAGGVTELERITDIAGTPVLGRRDVCAVAYQGRAACFDLGSGSTIWSREFSSSVGLDRDTRFAFITDAADVVHALDVFSGATVWTQNALVRRKISRPLVVGDSVIVGDGEGYVHALARESGEFAARTRAGSGAITADPLLLSPGRFVVQTRDGNVAAFEAR